jgi:hypothetical protein
MLQPADILKLPPIYDIIKNRVFSYKVVVAAARAIVMFQQPLLDTFMMKKMIAVSVWRPRHFFT